MKQLKKIFTLLTALVLCVTPLLANTITVHAEGTPTTFYVKYVDNLDSWKFQTGGWSDDAHPRDIYYMHEEIKNGDLLVIDGGSSAQKSITLEVKVSLSNLTVTYSDAALITAQSVDSFYALNDSISVVNAPVKNAFVYDYALVQFNGDVENLEVISSKGELLHATVGAAGTVNHVKAYSPSHTHFELYGFTKASLDIKEGALKTAEGSYSKTPVSTTTTTVPSSTSASSGSDSGEYDEVPKTADIRINPIWFVAIAVLCLAGKHYLAKES